MGEIILNRGVILAIALRANNSLNVNRYATKKTVSQGLLDIALLTSNAAQLKSILQTEGDYEHYETMLGLIITSLVLQALVGILFLAVGGMDINNEKYHRAADIINNIATIIIFIITFINIIIS